MNNFAIIIKDDWKRLSSVTRYFMGMGAVIILINWLFKDKIGEKEITYGIYFGLGLSILSPITASLFSIIKAQLLKCKYPLSGLGNTNGGFDVVSISGVWYLIDHRIKEIRWISSYSTAIKLLSPRVPEVMDKEYDSIEKLRKEKYKNYRHAKSIIISGNRGG